VFHIVAVCCLIVLSRIGNTMSDSHDDGPKLVDITLSSNDENCKLILSMPAKSSSMDKILTSVIKSCVNVFAPLICRLVIVWMQMLSAITGQSQT